MYYPSSENKGADQLRGYREADLRLCFRLGKNPVFSRCGSYVLFMQTKKCKGKSWRQSGSGAIRSGVLQFTNNLRLNDSISIPEVSRLKVVMFAVQDQTIQEMSTM